MTKSLNATRSTYQGHPILVMPDPKTGRELRIGYTKCRTILAHVDAIRAFVTELDEAAARDSQPVAEAAPVAGAWWKQQAA